MMQYIVMSLLLLLVIGAIFFTLHLMLKSHKKQCIREGFEYKVVMGRHICFIEY